MNGEDEDTPPLLTDVACPGDVLRPRGLWLPIQPASRRLTARGDPEWTRDMPDTLRHRGEDIANDVTGALRRVLDALRPPRSGNRE